MKSNRINMAPPVIEDLGTGRSYYNFDTVETDIIDEETSSSISSYDCKEVSVENPVTQTKIIQALKDQGYYVAGEKQRLKSLVKSDCERLNIPEG